MSLRTYLSGELMAGSVDQWGRSVGFCRVCDSKIIIEHAYEKMGVCASCARDLGNAYHIAHGGSPDPMLAPDQYKSWVEKRKAEKAETYQKKVIPKGIRRQVLERDAYRCKHCGDHKDLRADHIIPERNGGPTTLENLQTLCARCNSKKGWR